MPARSKFTAETRQRVLEAKRIGASDRTAAAIAGVDHSTLGRWLARGREASEGSRFREFVEAFETAAAEPRIRALAIVHKELPDNPTLAWKFIERREPGYATPTATPYASPGSVPQVIELKLSDGPEPPGMVPGEVINVALPDEHKEFTP